MQQLHSAAVRYLYGPAGDAPRREILEDGVRVTFPPGYRRVVKGELDVLRALVSTTAMRRALPLVRENEDVFEVMWASRQTIKDVMVNSSISLTDRYIYDGIRGLADALVYLHDHLNIALNGLNRAHVSCDNLNPMQILSFEYATMDNNYKVTLPHALYDAEEIERLQSPANGKQRDLYALGKLAMMLSLRDFTMKVDEIPVAKRGLILYCLYDPAYRPTAAKLRDSLDD